MLAEEQAKVSPARGRSALRSGALTGLSYVALSLAASERLEGRIAGDEAWREKLVNATATRRIPTVEEVAELITVLCSPKAAALTGSVIDLSAGAHLNNLW